MRFIAIFMLLISCSEKNNPKPAVTRTVTTTPAPTSAPAVIACKTSANLTQQAIKTALAKYEKRVNVDIKTPSRTAGPPRLPDDSGDYNYSGWVKVWHTQAKKYETYAAGMDTQLETAKDKLNTLKTKCAGQPAYVCNDDVKTTITRITALMTKHDEVEDDAGVALNVLAPDGVNTRPFGKYRNVNTWHDAYDARAAKYKTWVGEIDSKIQAIKEKFDVLNPCLDQLKAIK